MINGIEDWLRDFFFLDKVWGLVMLDHNSDISLNGWLLREGYYFAFSGRTSSFIAKILGFDLRREKS